MRGKRGGVRVKWLPVSLAVVRMKIRTRRMKPSTWAVRVVMPMLTEKAWPSTAGLLLAPMAWTLAAGLVRLVLEIAAGAVAVATAGVSWGRTVEMLPAGTVVVIGPGVGRGPIVGSATGLAIVG